MCVCFGFVSYFNQWRIGWIDGGVQREEFKGTQEEAQTRAQAIQQERKDAVERAKQQEQQEAAELAELELEMLTDQLEAVQAEFEQMKKQLEEPTAAPPAPVPAPAAKPAVFKYTVKRGDTLGKIAKRFYDDASEYMKIFEANKDQLEDPNKIEVIDIYISDRHPFHIVFCRWIKSW